MKQTRTWDTGSEVVEGVGTAVTLNFSLQGLSDVPDLVFTGETGTRDT